ncbi:LysR family transcriptional regulator [Granulosicoccus antarcticus]|uniref:HTH-type transcriptional regulator PgrR n=1 Tax=Granulosicoccus antarcticus IMCC3135 TaxID=1192854 RepID=A0A2Z2NU97_9GAMM|nr:LysR family transcriptional regulator [Granulosicoccus antarcticus]ASJ71227.1 HTH-type transcriptional regulator PgrR [Granulosicoccus antarcticus IMCC3135]
MKNTNLNDVAVFVQVAQAKGFRAAADNLNLGAGSVSEAIQRLESQLGVRLIERTTRKMSLTSAGEMLYQRTLPSLTSLKNALNELGDSQDAVTGTLRLSAPRSSSPFFLDDVIAHYARLYPSVLVEVMYDDTRVDLVTSGVDAAIRSQTLIEQETHAVEIGPALDMVLVASPDYLERHGTPEKPSELTDHDGIRFGFGRADRLAPWTFKQGRKSPYDVTPRARMVVNDIVSMIKFSSAGLGLAYVYRKPAEPYIARKELVTLFDKQVPQLPRYTINYLTKRHMPARLRAFIDLAKSSSSDIPD